MQKLSPGYIFTKLILVLLINLTGACLAVMFLQVAKSSELDSRLSRGLAGALGMLVYLFLQYRIIAGANLSRITKKDYLLGESISLLLYIIIAAVLCALFGEAALYMGWKTVFFLPMLPFVYLSENLYLGLALQFVLCSGVIWLFYEIKRRRDPSLLGRAKASEQK